MPRMYVAMPLDHNSAIVQAPKTKHAIGLKLGQRLVLLLKYVFVFEHMG